MLRNQRPASCRTVFDFGTNAAPLTVPAAAEVGIPSFGAPEEPPSFAEDPPSRVFPLHAAAPSAKTRAAQREEVRWFTSTFLGGRAAGPLRNRTPGIFGRAITDLPRLPSRRGA